MKWKKIKLSQLKESIRLEHKDALNKFLDFLKI